MKSNQHSPTKQFRIISSFICEKDKKAHLKTICVSEEQIRLSFTGTGRNTDHDSWNLSLTQCKILWEEKKHACFQFAVMLEEWNLAISSFRMSWMHSVLSWNWQNKDLQSCNFLTETCRKLVNLEIFCKFALQGISTTQKPKGPNFATKCRKIVDLNA